MEWDDFELTDDEKINEIIVMEDINGARTAIKNAYYYYHYLPSMFATVQLTKKTSTLSLILIFEIKSLFVKQSRNELFS